MCKNRHNYSSGACTVSEGEPGGLTPVNAPQLLLSCSLSAIRSSHTSTISIWHRAWAANRNAGDAVDTKITHLETGNLAVASVKRTYEKPESKQTRSNGAARHSFQTKTQRAPFHRVLSSKCKKKSMNTLHSQFCMSAPVAPGSDHLPLLQEIVKSASNIMYCDCDRFSRH